MTGMRVLVVIVLLLLGRIALRLLKEAQEEAERDTPTVVEPEYEIPKPLAAKVL